MEVRSKKTQGRQKIEIKEIEKKSSKQVTFSKRRYGVFKKAVELSVLCDTEMAVVVFSPNGKAFGFGYPSIDAVLHRYIYGNATADSSEAARALAAEFSRQFREAARELEAEKRRAEEAKLAAQEKGGKTFFWWEEEVIDGMSLEELQIFMDAMVEWRRKVVQTQHLLNTATPTFAATATTNGAILAAPLSFSSFLGGSGDIHHSGFSGDDCSSCFGLGFEGGEF